MMRIVQIVVQERVMRNLRLSAVPLLVVLAFSPLSHADVTELQGPGPAIPQAETQPPALTADDLWTALQTGNKQFMAGKIRYDTLANDRSIVAKEQSPPITILGCADSRVPPELIFNQTIGGLFVVRTAGSLADSIGLASIEYAVAHGWTSLLIVLAHEDCGAVRSSMGQGDPSTPSLVALAEKIRESFYRIDWNPNDPVAVRQATEANAKASATSLVARSALIRKAVAEGKLKIVIAYYSLETGAVTRIE
jgi:carbonic anhydrase